MKKIVSFILAASIIFGFIPLSQEVNALSTATVWDGSIANSFDGGSGTQIDPYLIATVEQLAYFASLVNSGNTFEGQYVVLTTDIYLNDVSDYEKWETTPPKNNWTPIGKSTSYVFKGNFIGQNHSVHGLYCVDKSYAGLFGAVCADVVIQNLRIEKAYVSGNYAGGLTAYVNVPQKTFATISNVTYSGTVNASTQYAGGIIGGYYAVAGLGANPYGCDIENCQAYGNIKGTSYVGGIIGYIRGTSSISNCTVNADITGSGNQIGGIAGCCNGMISDCAVFGSVTGESQVGGICGYSSGGETTACINYATIKGTSNIGGIWGHGYSDPTISECINLGDIIGTTHVAGIIGYLNAGGKVANCYNTGTVIGTGKYIGGIAGECYQNGATATLCYNIGLVNNGKGPAVCSEAWLGGSISNCYYSEGSGTGGDGIALTANQMAAETSFAGFDFDSVWTMDASLGRPVLKNTPEDVSSYLPSQSSEYSNLMGESWENAGMENFNEYLLTVPSISKAVVDSYNSNQSFMKTVASWKYTEYMFEPGNVADDTLSMKDYYSAILLSLINSEIVDENYAKKIAEAGQFEEIKISKELTKIIQSCDEIDHEKLLSGGTCTIEEITVLNNRINLLDDYSSAVSNVGKFLKVGQTINEGINCFINYSNVSNTSTYIVNVLQKMKQHSTDAFLAMAVDDIIVASESSFAAVTTGLYNGTINAGADFGVEWINTAWQKTLTGTTLGKGMLIGYKIGKPLSNILCSTDAIISNYFEFSALYEVEKAMKASIGDFETEFYYKVNANSSLNYINSVALFFKVYYLSLDYATNLSKYSNLCPWAYIFYNGKQKFEDATKQYESTRSELKEYEDQLFRLWSYSLKERYPDIYSEIAPSLGMLYSTDLSSALVRLEYLSETYTGEEIKPKVTVTMGNAVLLPNEYTVSYYNNVEPGLATVQITAVEGSIYTGTKAVSFTIKELPFVKRLSIRGSLMNTASFRLYANRSGAQSGIELPDVYFYDGDQPVASVENGIITKDNLPIFITEDGVDVLMQDKDYTVKISGDSDLTYNAELQTLDENYSILEMSNYNNLLLSDDIQCNIYADAADQVIVNDSIQTPDYASTNTSNNEEFSINFEQCATEDSACEGQRVYVGAIIPEGHIFTGWTVSPQLALSSNSSVTSFIMPSEPVSIIASFAENPSYFDLKDVIVKAAEIGPGKYTKSSYAALQLAIENSMFVLTDDIVDSLSKEKMAEIQSAVDALEEIPALAFKGASLSLQHNLAINYKVDKALFEDVGYTDPYVVFELNGVKTKVSSYTVSGDRYIFAFRNIAPNQMNDAIYATLYATYNGVEYAGATREYSVAEYCYSMLDLYSADEYAELRTLLVDLLNYGAASQTYTDYRTDALVNTSLTDAQLLWGTSTDPALDTVLDTAYKTVENPIAKWKGAGLNLQESISIRFKFTAENVEDLKVIAESGTSTWTIFSDEFYEEDGVYYVYFTGLDAGQMRQSVYLTIYDGDTPVSNTVCYSIGSYAYEKQNSTIAGLPELVKAMMKYGDSAYAYVH